jgi:NAD(P)-dependent dehydrogenase (short-subunit alcohol dehydrogenase family)
VNKEPTTVALITGAGSGLGRYCARTLAKDGTSVYVADVDKTAAKRVAAEIEAEGGLAIAGRMDVTDEASVIKTYERLASSWAKLDILVANAGISGVMAIATEDLTEEAWDVVMNVNLKGVFLSAKHAIPLLKENGGGAIVATSSAAAYLPFMLTGAYGPSKAGVISLVRGLAMELAPFNIRVNAVAPGGMNTGFGRTTATESAPLRTDEENAEWLAAMKTIHPIAPSLEPWSVAETVAFLASAKASFITGQCLIADGGLTVSTRSAPPGWLPDS